MKKNGWRFTKWLASIFVFTGLLLGIANIFMPIQAKAESTNPAAPQATTFTVSIKGENTLSYDDMWNGRFGFQLQEKIGDKWENIAIVSDESAEDNYTKFVDMSVDAPTEATSKKTVNFDIFELTKNYDKAGEYNYRIVELIPETKRAGVTYDTHSDEFTVVISKTNKNTLCVSNIYSSTLNLQLNMKNGEVVSCNPLVAKFTNQYSSSGIATLSSISGTKILSGRDWKNSDLFTFELYRGEKNNSGIVNAVGDAIMTDTVAGSDADHNFTFIDRDGLAFTFDATGTYYFVIKEQSGTIPGISYDSKEHVVEVNVTKDDQTNKLTAAMSLVGDDTITFTNSYTPNAITITSINGTKILSGRDWKDSDLFTFELYRAEKDNNGNLKTVGDAILTDDVKGTDADHIFTFTDKDSRFLTFDSAGTYYFIIKEQLGNAPGITYDSKKHEFRIEVMDRDFSGQLSTEVYLNDEEINLSEMEESVIFTNTWESETPGTSNPSNDSAKPQTQPQTPPRTGDESNILLLALTAMIAMIFASAMVLEIRRKRQL